MNDTTPEAARIVRKWVIARSGMDRLEMASGMLHTARTMAMASFPSGLDDIEIRRRLCQRFYGNEVDVDGFVRALLSRRSDR